MPKKSGVAEPFQLHPKTNRAYITLKGTKSKGGGFGFIIMRLVRDTLVVSAVENDRGTEEGDHHIHDFIDELAMQNALVLGIFKWQGRLVLTEYIPKGTDKSSLNELRKAKKWFLKKHPKEIYHSEGVIKGPSPGKKLPKKKLTQELKTHAMMVDSVETRDIMVSESELIAAGISKRDAGDLGKYAEMASRDEDLKKILFEDNDSKGDDLSAVSDPTVGGDMIASAPNLSEMPVKSAAEEAASDAKEEDDGKTLSASEDAAAEEPTADEVDSKPSDSTGDSGIAEVSAEDPSEKKEDDEPPVESEEQSASKDAESAADSTEPAAADAASNDGPPQPKSEDDGESKSEDTAEEASSPSSKAPTVPITLHETAHSGFSELMSQSNAYHLIFDMKGDTLVKLSLGTLVLAKKKKGKAKKTAAKKKAAGKSATVLDRELSGVKPITPFHQLFFESTNIRARLGCVVYENVIFVVLWSPPTKKWSKKMKLKQKKESVMYHSAAAERLIDEFGSLKRVHSDVLIFKQSKVKLEDYLERVKAAFDQFCAL